MKRLLVTAALAGAVASAFAATPASATPGGVCDGKIDVACTFWYCNPQENPCTVSPVCLLWLNNRCAV